MPIWSQSWWLAIAAVLTLVISCAEPPAATTPEALATLLREVEEAGGGRAFAGRLSIATEHQLCVAASGSAADGGAPVDAGPTADDGPPTLRCIVAQPPADVLRRVLRARAAALDALRDDRDGATLHRAALATLLLAPRRDDLLRAREQLEEAIAVVPDDATIHQDLAAVLLALAADDVTELPAALEHALAARALRPGDPAACWNAALATQALSLPLGATRVWDDCLALGADDAGWIVEGRERRALIVAVDRDALFERRTEIPPASAEAARTLVREHPDRVVGYLLERLLPAWAASAAAGANARGGEARGDVQAHNDVDTASNGEAHGDDDGMAFWRAANLVADALHDVLGDDCGRDLLAAASPGALDAYARGRGALRADDLAGAESGLREVLRVEPDGAGPLAAWARTWLALIAVYRGEHERAEDLLAAVERAADLERYPTLAGRVLWHRGLSLARRGLDGLSLPTFRRAEALFLRLGDRRSAASIQLLLSEDLKATGRPLEAWDARLRALRALARHPRAIPLHNALLELARSAQSDGRPQAALAFAEEAVALADAGNDTISIAEANELLGLLEAAAGRLDVAARHFGRAEAAAERIRDEAFRGQVTADLALARATSLSASTAGADPFVSLLDHYRGQSLRPKIIAVLSARARRRALAGNAAGAAADYEAALAELVDKDRTLDGVGDRLAHGEVAGEIFEALIVHHAERGDVVAALAYLECARLAPYRPWVYPRLGLDLDADCGALRPALDTRRAALTAGEMWRVYLARGEELLVWTLERDGVRLDRWPIARAELRRRVEAFARAVEADDDAAEGVADEALRPLLSLDDVAAGARVVVVPDAVLARLPFAALRDPGSGRRLIEDVTLALAARVTPRGEGAARADRDSVGPALLVADPAFDPSFGDFRALDAARDEIAAVAGHVASPRVLVGAAATQRAILEALPGAALFYFAGHAVAHADDPFLSYLLLAAPGDPPAQQLLRADELFGVDLGELRLAVLSACETAAAPIARTAPAAALAGLAMPFLLRGDATVVATLRRVDDRASAELMSRFHRHRAAGLASAEALRAAQLELLGGADPALRRPAAWAWTVVVE